MKTIFAAVIFFCISLSTFLSAQDKKAVLIFDDIEAHESTTIRVDISSYHFNTIGTLKDKLLAYPEKVLDIKFDDKKSEMILSYNGSMLKEDLIRAFQESGIAYRPKSPSTFSTNEQE